MKRLSLAVATLSAICLTFQSAQASLLFSEAFNYNPGDALGSSGTWSGGNSGMTIGSGNLTYSGLSDLSPSGNDFAMAWGSAGSIINQFTATDISSGQIYYSFLLNMTTGSGGNSYLTAMNPGTTTPGGSSDAVDIYIDGTHANALRLRTAGQSEFSSGSSPTLSLNTTYLVVLGYDFGTSTASLWLDPTSLGGAAPGATETITGTGAVAGIGNVGFKAQSTTGDFEIDTLRVGTTWADVTPSAVPEPSTIALMGLGILGLVSSARRRLRR